MLPAIGPDGSAATCNNLLRRENSPIIKAVAAPERSIIRHIIVMTVCLGSTISDSNDHR
jgi:hypothetical protein